MEKIKYNGFDIKYDEKYEVWFTNVGEDGNQCEYDSSATRVQNASLKKLKEMLDIVKRRKFQRMSVFIRRPGRYRLGDGRDEFYESQYVEAVVTSISPKGDAFVVIKGNKHPEKMSLWYGDSGIILDTKENRKKIDLIEKQGEIEWKAECE